MQAIKRFLKDEEGATMVEYGLMLALIAVVCVVAIQIIGTRLNDVFTLIGNCLQDAANCPGGAGGGGGGAGG